MNLEGRDVLVTGGRGFLGRHLCARLWQCNPRSVLSFRSNNIDLRDQVQVRTILKKCQPQVVVHLAASVGGIGANRKNPGKYFYDSAIMGLNLIEECRLAGVEKFVCIGTVCSYPKHCPVPFSEADLWNGYPEETNAPYGLAKKMLLVQLQAYRQQYGFNGIYLIPTNLYGPGDNFDLETCHVIPALIRKAIEARDFGQDHIDVWGSGEATRDFLYVEDCADAIALATEQYDESEPVNLGSHFETSIHTLAKLIAEMVGLYLECAFDKSQPDGQPHRCLDYRRAIELFGWKPKTALIDGLQATIDWYEEHRHDKLKEVLATW